MPIPGQPTTPKAVCPHCGADSCYHCWECGCDTHNERHKSGCSGDMSITVPKCKACDGTGRASNNKRCYPCNGTGRQGAVKEIEAEHTREVDSLWG
jgi:hypothetical protein